MSQFHGYPTRSKISEKTKNVNTCPSCNFAEEISKLCYNLVRNFHDFQDEIIDFKNCNKKTLQRKYSVKGNSSKFITQNNSGKSNK